MVSRRIAHLFRAKGTGSGDRDAREPQTVEPHRPAPTDRFIIFSDTDNDLESVKSTLRFAGILNRKGEFTADTEGITIVHTGDLISKANPDPSVVDYWEILAQDALRHGCRVKLIAGNHEQETWLQMKAGKKPGIAGSQAPRLNRFIENLDLFHVTGPILFLHGYPTVEFLQALLHYKEVTGEDLNQFNEDHYKKSLISMRAMKQYAYVRNGRKIHHLLYDIKDAGSYYKKNGEDINSILSDLDIRVIVHGHKPQKSGLQADYELNEWVPGVRVINNDTNVSRRGIGATVIRKASSGSFEIAFINSKDRTEEHSLTIRRILGTSCKAITEPPVAAASQT